MPDVKLLDFCVPEGLPIEDQVKHGAMSVYIEGASRVLTHELVRHRRNMSYSQQSQRYVDERGFNHFEPTELEGEALEYFNHVMEKSKGAYEKLRELEVKKQIARYVLPNAVEAPIVVTGTWNAWEHFFRLRTDKAAQPEMRLIASLIAMNAGVKFPAAFTRWFITGATVLREFGWEWHLKTVDLEPEDKK